MPSTKRLLNQALMLSDSGKKADARKLLLTVLNNDPHNGKALLLYLDTFETRAERARGLELLFKRQNPLSGSSN
ncbi:MAG: hypothetical protein ISR58_00360 [Anaerolineales bacterium]|nr:hypothetical protein [Chloroflexota bacterium]MBL6979615.1 hypothetical protein [Anaerolineales bacterium]